MMIDSLANISIISLLNFNYSRNLIELFLNSINTLSNLDISSLRHQISSNSLNEIQSSQNIHLSSFTINPSKQSLSIFSQSHFIILFFLSSFLSPLATIYRNGFDREKITMRLILKLFRPAASERFVCSTRCWSAFSLDPRSAVRRHNGTEKRYSHGKRNKKYVYGLGIIYL